MSEYCVVTVDGVRARFFTLAKAAQPAVESGPNLVEEPEALISTESDIPGGELWGDTKSGRAVGGGGGPVHAYDDHREQHTDEVKRRFAKAIAEQAVQLAQSRGAKHLVLAAEKQMLGFMRGALHVPPKAGFDVRELAKDLSRLSPRDLQGHLAAEGLVPPRNRPS